MRRVLISIVFLFVSLCVFATDTTGTGKWYIRVGMHGGFIPAHREQMSHLLQGHSAGAFVQLLKPTDGSREWHTLYNYPETGFDLFYLSTGNPRQLGNQMGICYTANLPLNRRLRETPRFRHWIGLGIGAGYATRIWDLETNHQSDVLGSHLNAALVLAWYTRLAKRNHFDLQTGLRITHFSNGAYQLPNLGTNNVALFLAAGFGSTDVAKHTTDPISAKGEKKITFSISASAGLQEIPPFTYKKYPVGTFSTWMNFRTVNKHSWTAGFDVFKKEALLVLLERRNGEPAHAIQSWQSGFAAGYNMHFNRLSFAIQQGLYLTNSWKDSGLLYHRFGLQYEITNHLQARLMLKTHFARADHSEWGIAYVF